MSPTIVSVLMGRKMGTMNETTMKNMTPRNPAKPALLRAISRTKRPAPVNTLSAPPPGATRGAVWTTFATMLPPSRSDARIELAVQGLGQ